MQTILKISFVRINIFGYETLPCVFFINDYLISPRTALPLMKSVHLFQPPLILRGDSLIAHYLLFFLLSCSLPPFSPAAAVSTSWFPAVPFGIPNVLRVPSLIPRPFLLFRRFSVRSLFWRTLNRFWLTKCTQRVRRSHIVREDTTNPFFRVIIV